VKKILVLIIYLILSIGFIDAQHLKKDGTPDMRYKENKSNYYPTYHTTPYSQPSYNKPSYSGRHLKKDGTPDMRYKENKNSYTRPIYTVPKTESKSYGTYQVNRDKNGRIKRNESARYQFMKKTGYPHGRPGYVIDHIIPLKKGGCDCPSNMQWQTIEEAKAKDKWE